MNKEYSLRTKLYTKCCMMKLKHLTVGLNMYVTLKKCPHMLNILLIPLNTSELTTSQNFFVTVWSTGGVIITFAENWNFELKFFLVNSFREKMTSR